ncbi:hypothetical protein [Desulfitobacterium hafniense]|uniref:t-SNARE coiled-coil homology domain-containing protein n=3 Tax=root TaxID=1 RepID=Q24T10_DESHY|nr:hypothetical protein [Desulfitobacterium hafniense]EHL04641.1 hypothetical protein HMPREF0322_04728 [Desulfitobacterium hafniense DP7]MEA5021330.1 hypothetical protein [Desulfitobacterium hafniense]BAE84832.1 hypothetical protein DSY3043 [Desulfitobacterium hafniense Y51]
MENERLILELLQGINQQVQGINQQVQGIDQRVQGIDQRVQGIEQRVQGIDQRLRKVEVSIDDIRKDIKILAEGQVAHREQNEREHEQIIRLIDDKTVVLEKAIVHNSVDIREIKEEQDEVFEVLSKRRVQSVS